MQPAYRVVLCKSSTQLSRLRQRITKTLLSDKLPIFFLKTNLTACLCVAILSRDRRPACLCLAILSRDPHFRERACVLIRNQRPLRRLTDEIKSESDRKNQSSLQLFLQTGTVRNLPFVVLLLPNQKNERVFQPDFRF